MPHRTEAALATALDDALARALAGPELPANFRVRLQAALARTAALDPAAMRRAVEAEHHRQLASLRADFIRIRRRTLGSLIGVAFCAGAAIAVAMPWIIGGFGAAAAIVAPTLGAAVGVAIGVGAWLRRDDLAQRLP